MTKKPPENAANLKVRWQIKDIAITQIEFAIVDLNDWPVNPVIQRRTTKNEAKTNSKTII